MSMRFVAEEYQALRFMFRISIDPQDYEDHRNRADIEANARMIAAECEKVLAVDGSNIFYGDGRWKGGTEFGATIEVVRRIDTAMPYFGIVKHAMEAISEYVNKNHGLTCFATVEPTTAYELYELAE